MTGRGLDRLIVVMMEGCCQQIWGFSPRMISSIVADKGALRALFWFIANMPRYLLTLRILGAVRTHLACATISIYNGCVYCAYGQVYALELIYLRDFDRLFPLDARLLRDWLHLETRQLGNQPRRVLREADLHTEAAWVDLTIAFTRGEQLPIDETEVRLAHLVGMITEMNRIAIASGDAPDGAHNSINKDKTLRARHAALRRAAMS
jgi:hypothetical protein